MINYKSFKLSNGAKLRVKTESIVATMSSKDTIAIDIYVAGLPHALHVPVDDSRTAGNLMDIIWERSKFEDLDGDE